MTPACVCAAAFLMGCRRTGEAIVIDPERDVDRYEKISAANGLRIVAVAETHSPLSGGRMSPRRLCHSRGRGLLQEG